VWFDYPQVNKVGCMSHQTVASLLRDSQQGALYDAQRFYAPGSPRVCLRLSDAGLRNVNAALVT
jgi:hypothetical protein